MDPEILLTTSPNDELQAFRDLAKARNHTGLAEAAPWQDSRGSDDPDDAARTLQRSIANIADDQLRAAAQALFPLPYLDSPGSLSERRQQASEVFFVSPSTFRSGTPTKPSREDLVLTAVAGQVARFTAPAQRTVGRNRVRAIVAAAALVLVAGPILTQSDRAESHVRAMEQPTKVDERITRTDEGFGGNEPPEAPDAGATVPSVAEPRLHTAPDQPPVYLPGLGTQPVSAKPAPLDRSVASQGSGSPASIAISPAKLAASDDPTAEQPGTQRSTRATPDRAGPTPVAAPDGRPPGRAPSGPPAREAAAPAPGPVDDRDATMTTNPDGATTTTSTTNPERVPDIDIETQTSAHVAAVEVNADTGDSNPDPGTVEADTADTIDTAGGVIGVAALEGGAETHRACPGSNVAVDPVRLDRVRAMMIELGRPGEVCQHTTENRHWDLNSVRFLVNGDTTRWIDLVFPDDRAMVIPNAAWTPYRTVVNTMGGIERVGRPASWQLRPDGSSELTTEHGTILNGPATDTKHVYVTPPFTPLWLANRAELGDPMADSTPLVSEFEHGRIELTDDGLQIVLITPEQARAQLPPDEQLASSIIRQPSGTAWYVDSQLRRWWIPNGDVWSCLGGSRTMSANHLEGAAVASVPFAGRAGCELANS